MLYGPDDKMNRFRFARVAAVSAVIAIASCLSPLVLGEKRSVGPAFLLATAWIAVIVTVFLLFKKRAFWLLFGVPFALYWPSQLLLLAISCAFWYPNGCP